METNFIKNLQQTRSIKATSYRVGRVRYRQSEGYDLKDLTMRHLATNDLEYLLALINQF